MNQFDKIIQKSNAVEIAAAKDAYIGLNFKVNYAIKLLEGHFILITFGIE